MKLRVPVRRDTLRKDAVAGLVLGVESVPDGLAAGLLAGVNPLSGLYAYLFGTVGGSFFTSSAFMAVQATGAMAIVIADVPAVHSAADPAQALFTCRTSAARNNATPCQRHSVSQHERQLPSAAGSA